MRYKRLGRTNLNISELSLGTVELGLDYGISHNGDARRPSEIDAARLLHFALDRGINFIDTARAYGEAERIIGAALKERRHEYVLASKVLPGRNEARSQVDASLVALRTDYVDIMMIHCRADQVQPDRETFESLDRARTEGKIRFIGASVYGPEAATAAVCCGWFDCVEAGYSALDRRIENEMLPLAEAKDIGVIARSVLLKGALSERYLLLPETLEPLKACVAKLAQLAGSAAQLPELAYRYAGGRRLPHSLLVGTASPAEIDACIGYLERGPLSTDEMRAVREIHLDDDRWLNPGNWPSA